jgi:hypothetical protein
MILLKIFLITWFITHFELIQDTLLSVFDRLCQSTDNNILKRIYDSLYTILSCHKCLSFWTTLIVTQDIFMACGVSFIAYLLNRKK